MQWVSEMLHNTELWKRRHHPARKWEHWLSSQASAMFPKLLFVIHAGLWMHENSRKQKEHVPFFSNLRKMFCIITLYTSCNPYRTLCGVRVHLSLSFSTLGAATRYPPLSWTCILIYNLSSSICNANAKGYYLLVDCRDLSTVKEEKTSFSLF